MAAPINGFICAFIAITLTTMNSLVADYGDETDSDESSQNDVNQDEQTKDTKQIKIVDQIKLENKLPAPRFKETGSLNESVFRNPYLEAERAKSAVLEKHVKMVPAKDCITQVNGKNICWMNRKGRCRFGNKCKFAHDSELFNDPKVLNKDTVNKDDNNSNKRKKRPGLSQTLIPGKKVLKMFKKTELCTLK